MANAITSAVAFMIKPSEDQKPDLQSINEHISAVITKSITSHAKYWNAHDKKIMLFLTSTEVEVLVRQIFASKILRDNNLEQYNDVSEEFESLWAMWFRNEGGFGDAPVNSIFEGLVKGCESALDNAIAKGTLSAHEAKSMFRHNMLIKEIDGIKGALEFLTGSNVDVEAVNHFTNSYRDQLHYRSRTLRALGKNLTIDKFYVHPDIVSFDERHDSQGNITLREIVRSHHRAVILGTPGAGKSTLAQKLCFDLTFNSNEVVTSEFEVTPLLIILRDYGVFKKNQKISFVEFIEKTIYSDLQIKPPDNAIDYLLVTGRTLVIFDGLDELLETSYRQMICSDIELFCNAYKAVPVIVTSREVGYDEAPLNLQVFEKLRVNPFNKNQILSYVTKWFSHESDLPEDQQKQLAESFMTESSEVAELTSNPLMLNLLCNIYKSENYIPANRPEVYKKCAEMLFEKWDRARSNIPVEFTYEKDILPNIAYLAFWIYTNDELQSGVSDLQLIDKSAEYLHQKRYDDLDEARAIASTFISHCCGRAWIFTYIGENKEWQKVFKFTHTTFLEYFTALYLVRLYETSTQLADFLYPKVQKNEWDVVAQLAFQIKTSISENASEELFLFVMTKVESDDVRNAWHSISFLVRTLDYINPNIKILRTLANKLVSITVNLGKYYRQERPESSIHISSVFYSIARSNNENNKIIIQEIQRLVVEKLNECSSDNEYCLEILDLIPNYDFSTIKRESLVLLAKKSELAAKILLFKNIISSSEYVDFHGLAAIFMSSRHLTNPMSSHISIADIVIYNFNGFFCDIPFVYSMLDVIALAFDVIKIPVSIPYKYENEVSPIIMNGHVRVSSKELPIFSLSPDQIFGLFYLVSATYEINAKINLANDYVSELERFDNKTIKIITSIIASRYNTIKDNAYLSVGFSQKQLDMVSKWIEGKIDFVGDIGIEPKLIPVI